MNPSTLFGRLLDDGADALTVRASDGDVWSMPMGRWLAPATDVDERVLDRAVGPVLDVGCGPGRHVAALGARGIEALGIDVLPEALRVARRRGADVLQRSAFGAVPREGEWATVLLLDGNVGIGGDPAALLRRVRELLAPDGVALVELEGRGVGVQHGLGRIETPQGRSARFPWGRVGADAIGPLAEDTGFVVDELRCAAGRWFAWVRPAP